LRVWEGESKSVPFDHETGRFIEQAGEESRRGKRQGSPKARVVSMRYGCLDSQKVRSSASPLQNYVASVRKVTSFTRPERRRILLEGEEEPNEASYNNNGQRQHSVIPFLEAQQGVILSEGGSQTSGHRRTISSARGPRGFKSYAMEKVEAASCYRTINTAVSGGRGRLEQAGESKETRRTSVPSGKGSVLWGSEKREKDHRISKHCELGDSFLEFSEQLP
jgi:hypothetical protein